MHQRQLNITFPILFKFVRVDLCLKDIFHLFISEKKLNLAFSMLLLLFLLLLLLLLLLLRQHF